MKMNVKKYKKHNFFLAVVLSGLVFFSMAGAVAKVSTAKPQEESAETPDKDPGTEARSEQLYPEGALKNAISEEANEIKLLEEAKEQAIHMKEEYELRKSDAEKQILVTKKKIEDSKIEQEKIQQELEFMNTDFSRVDAERGSIQGSMAEAKAGFDKVAAEHQEVKSKHIQKMQDLKEQSNRYVAFKRSTEEKISNLQVEVERMRQGIAETENAVSQMLNQKAHAEALLARNQTELDVVLVNMAEARRKKTEASVASRETDRKLKLIRRQLSEYRTELVSIEKERDKFLKESETAKNLALSESKKLGQQMAENMTAQLALDSEKAKYDVEKDRLSTALAAARARKEAMDQKTNEDRTIVLESRVKVEQAKTQIAQLNSSTEKQKLDSDSLKVKVRNLASMASQSDIGDEQIQIWTMVKSCFLRSQASESSNKMGLVKKGLTVAGQPNGTFVKVLNSSGHPLFMPLSCLQLKDDQ